MVFLRPFLFLTFLPAVGMCGYYKIGNDAAFALYICGVRYAAFFYMKKI